MSLARATYQFTASACADLVTRVPALEPALVRVGPHVWHWRHTGRFYRSVAGRYADGLRQSPVYERLDMHVRLNGFARRVMLMNKALWDSEAHRLLCGSRFVPQALDTNGPLMNIAYER